MRKNRKTFKKPKTGHKIGIPESYIGSTFRFGDRKREHLSRCNNVRCKEYVYPVYSFIRCNGGFDEWDFRIIETNKFNSKHELKSREQYYLDIYQDNLLNKAKAKI